MLYAQLNCTNCAIVQYFFDEAVSASVEAQTLSTNLRSQRFFFVMLHVVLAIEISSSKSKLAVYLVGWFLVEKTVALAICI